MIEHTIEKKVDELKSEVIGKFLSAMRALVLNKAKELGDTHKGDWHSEHMQEKFKEFFKKMNLAQFNQFFKIRGKDELLILLELLENEKQFNSHYESENTPRDQFISGCRHIIAAKIYEYLVTEYIEHVKNTEYPEKQKIEKLTIAYRLKADLIGDDIAWKCGRSNFIARTSTAYKEADDRINEFKEGVKDTENKEALSKGINSIGHIILDTLSQAVEGLKNFFAGSTAEPKIALLPKSSFLGSSKTMGKAFVDAVIKPSPRPH